MIIKGSQRGSARQLAAHLLNTEENDHVEVHEVRGFIARNVKDAMQEMHALSRGTRCTQFMFSVSLNPPQSVNAPIAFFEQALADIEQKCGLKGQPRIVIFHEKEGRRHCHAVWSRIDAQEMKAVNLSFFKTRLNEISKALYLKHGWEIPQGFLDKQYSNPLNFTLDEWQQAKRMDVDPKLLKAGIKQAWDKSPCRTTFEKNLQNIGLWLARGDRRGFVAVDMHGEVLSLSRWAGIKSKELKDRLGKPSDLPSVEDVKRDVSSQMTDNIRNYIKDTKTKAAQDIKPHRDAVQTMKHLHQRARKTLDEQHRTRCESERQQRVAAMPRGLWKLWRTITGEYRALRVKHEQDIAVGVQRDRTERQALISAQLLERQKLNHVLRHHRAQAQETLLSLRQDMTVFERATEQPETPTQHYRHAPEI